MQAVRRTIRHGSPKGSCWPIGSWAGGPPDDKRYQAHDIAGSETLIALADRLRGLMVQNDPDAVRAGLAQIADALDTFDPDDWIEADIPKRVPSKR